MESYKVSVEKSISRQEIMGFLLKIFEPCNKNARRDFDNIFDYEPSFSAGNFIIARNSQDALIGLVRIVDRKLRAGGEILDSAGVSSIGVLLEYRNKGVCSLMMKKAHNLMRERGKDIAVLYARRALDGFYTQYGYFGIGKYIDLELSISQARKTLKYTHFIGSKSQILSIMKFYNKDYLRLSGYIKRTPEVWRFLFTQLRDINLFLFKSGYCLIRENKVIELSLSHKNYEYFLGLLNQLKINTLSIHPQHPFFKYCRTHINTTILKERIVLDGGYMGRIINLKKLWIKNLLTKDFYTCAWDEI
jgi:predicted acetyltransferase